MSWSVQASVLTLHATWLVPVDDSTSSTCLRSETISIVTSSTDLDAMFNAAALRDYATVMSPARQIQPSVLLTHNEQCIAIFDAFPKAKYHFLILPRYPFPLDPGTGISDDIDDENEEQDTSKATCRVSDLDDLSSLMLRTTTSTRKVVIEAMAGLAKEVEEMVEDEMMKTEGFTWGVNVGFHAVPSMK